MVQSPSWETNWFAASQEIPRISRNPKVHYRTHKRPPPLSILGQPNPVHIPTPTSWRSILILSTHLRLGLPVVSFPPVSPPRPYIPPFPHPYAPHAQPISFFSILSPAQYWVRSTNHLAPRYAIEYIYIYIYIYQSPMWLLSFSQLWVHSLPSSSMRSRVVVDPISGKSAASAILTTEAEDTPETLANFRFTTERYTS